MKKILCTLTLLFVGIATYAQSDYTDLIKERQALAKLSKEEINAKASKSARVEAKKLVKEGWKVAPGSMPIEKQLDRRWKMQVEQDEDGFPKYIMGQAASKGGNYDAARMQALNLAKIELAGNIATEVTALIESDVENNQMDANEAQSVTESVMGSVNTIAQSIGRTIVVSDFYRELSNKNVEVSIVLFYNGQMAKEAAKKAIKDDMMKRGDVLVNKLEKLLGF